MTTLCDYIQHDYWVQRDELERDGLHAGELVREYASTTLCKQKLYKIFDLITESSSGPNDKLNI